MASRSAVERKATRLRGGLLLEPSEGNFVASVRPLADDVDEVLNLGITDAVANVLLSEVGFVHLGNRCDQDFGAGGGGEGGDFVLAHVFSMHPLVHRVNTDGERS